MPLIWFDNARCGEAFEFVQNRRPNSVDGVVLERSRRGRFGRARFCRDTRNVFLPTSSIRESQRESFLLRS